GIGVGATGRVAVFNSTIINNQATGTSGSGGGIGGNATVTTNALSVESSIISGNVAVNGPDIRFGPTINLNYSAIGSKAGFSYMGTTKIFGAALNLGPLANNGGPTLTHAILTPSPAIDAGDDALLL